VSLQSEAKAGYHGVGYCASWDLDSLSYMTKLFNKIRHATKEKDFYNVMIYTGSFNDKLDRLWHDQTVDDKEFEPLEVVKSTNRIVNDGLVRIAELVTGSNHALWTHLAVGSGGNQVSMSDSFLQTEIERVGLTSDGFQSAAGSVMRYGGFFAPSVSSCQVLEAGVFDDPTEGIMFFRTVYPTGITHVVNSDFFSVAHSIYQVSV
jgi:hypothetical protein